MDSMLLNDAWYTVCPLDDFRSVLRLICDELMKIAWAAVSLLFVFFSTVCVTARLAECVLNAVIREPEVVTCSPPTMGVVKDFFNWRSIRSALTATSAMFLWWLYVNTVVRPVYLLVAGSALSAVQFCGYMGGAILTSGIRWGKVFL